MTSPTTASDAALFRRVRVAERAWARYRRRALRALLAGATERDDRLAREAYALWDRL